jgi:protocatechuate 3,4-dioxygenase beta subunit
MVLVSAKGRVAFQKELEVPASGSETFQAKLELGVRFAGRVVDLENKPVAGAKLSAFDSTQEDESRRRSGGWSFFSFVNASETAHAESDADGRFEIDGLSPTGTYRLHVVHPRYVVLDLPGLEGTAGGGHDALEVPLEPAAWVTGVVVDTTGKPVANARVHGPAEDASDWMGVLAWGTVRISASGVVTETSGESKEKDPSTTDAQGRFRVGSLSAGDSRITASADGYFDGNVVVDGLEAGKEKPDVRIVIEPATAWLDGTILDDAGRPVAGAEVWADGDQGRASQGKTDDKGRFRLEHVRSRAPVSLQASHAGHVMQSMRAVALNTSGLKLTMPRTAHVRLKVVDPDGRLVDRVTVSITVGDETGRRHTSWTQETQDEKGVDLEVSAGEVRVKVTAKGLRPKTAGPFTATPGKTVDGGVLKMEPPKRDKDGKVIPDPDDPSNSDDGSEGD